MCLNKPSSQVDIVRDYLVFTWATRFCVRLEWPLYQKLHTILTWNWSANTYLESQTNLKDRIYPLNFIFLKCLESRWWKFILLPPCLFTFICSLIQQSTTQHLMLVSHSSRCWNTDWTDQACILMKLIF